MYKSRDYDVSKDLSQIGDSQTEAGISRPSMLVHSAVVTERQHSTRSTGAEVRDKGVFCLFFYVL